MKSSHKNVTRRLLASSAGLVAISVVMGAGLQLVKPSLAAGINPYGFADYCTYQSGIGTVVYGWAADPNAISTNDPAVLVTVAGHTQRLQANLNYRTTPINAYIDKYHSGDPKPGVYGWRANYSGLYKGSVYSISGTIINVGAGTDQPLNINKMTVDGDTSKTLFTSNNTLPDTCLAARPALPPPPPAPAPAPTPAPPRPTPTPSPTPTPIPKPRPSPTATPTPASAAAPPLSADTNAHVTTGTMAVLMTIPAGNAALLHVTYGTDPHALSSSTADQSTNGTDSIVSLLNLKPSTTYTYHIVRGDGSGKIVNSADGSFQTDGFKMVVHFVNDKSVGVKGISGQISSLKLNATSDTDGQLSFGGLAPGIYSFNYSYLGKAESQTLTAQASDINPVHTADAAEAQLDYYINVDKLTVTTKPQTVVKAKSSTKSLFIIIGLVLLLAMVLMVVRLRRRRRAITGHQYDYYNKLPPAIPAELGLAPSPPHPNHAVPIVGTIESPPFAPPALPAPTPAIPAKPAASQARAGHSKSNTVTAPLKPIKLTKAEQSYLPENAPAHMGESLKTMVLRSMAEEARRRQSNTHLPDRTPNADDKTNQPH